MASLLTLGEARALVKTALTDEQLRTVIEREESWLVSVVGAHYVNGSTTVQETLEGGGANLFLRRKAASVSSITEDATALAAGDYRLWGGQGRIERLPAGSKWTPGVAITVTYVPADDNALRKSVLIELVRLSLERTAMKGESVAGEYSYQAPDWEAERKRVARRLMFVGV